MAKGTSAGLEYFWIYDLRHTHTSRLAIANVSPIFIAQMIGHSSPNILSTYAKANEESRRLAICKLDALLEGIWLTAEQVLSPLIPISLVVTLGV